MEVPGLKLECIGLLKVRHSGNHVRVAAILDLAAMLFFTAILKLEAIFDHSLFVRSMVLVLLVIKVSLITGGGFKIRV